MHGHPINSEHTLALRAQLAQKINDGLLPVDTTERVNSVEQDLNRAEFELGNTEVSVVALDGQTLVEARDAVIRIYEMLVEVKNNLEDLIKTKRELQAHDVH